MCSWDFVGGAAFAGGAPLTPGFFGGGFFGGAFEGVVFGGPFGSGPFVGDVPFPVGLFGGACLLSAATLAKLKGAKAAALGPNWARSAI